MGALTRQWYRGINPISGQTATTYVTVSADYGLAVTCICARSNAAGTGTSQSNAITVTATAPVCTVDPVITGSATAGSTLTSDGGTFTGSAVVKSYSWYDAGVVIPAATASTYVTLIGQVGDAITNKVTGTNIVVPGGVTSNASNAITVTAPIAQNVWNSAVGTGITYSVGDTVATLTSGTDHIAKSLAGKSSGKWRVKIALSGDGSNNFVVGAIRSDVSVSAGYPGVGGSNGVGQYGGGIIFKGSAGTASPSVNNTDGTTSDLVIDLDNGTIHFYVNTVSAFADIALTGWSAGQTYHYAFGTGGGSGQVGTITQGWTTEP